MREKLKSLDELKERGLYIIDEDEIVVENNIEQICKERGILISDLAKITGISRQNINAVTKSKMKPGIDFALKCSYVLGVPVEELFTLTDAAWLKPYKRERDSTLYVDVVNLEIIDNATRKDLSNRGYEYYDKENASYLTKSQRDEQMKAYVEDNLAEKMEEIKSNLKNVSLNRINSIAIDTLKNEFGKNVVKLHQKLGEKTNYYVADKNATKKK